MDALTSARSPLLATPGGVRAVLEAAARAGADAALAMVVETEGSTYVRPGAVALFGGPLEEQVGWLSGGCLEPEIARHAASAAANGRIEWLDIDTRDDEDLFAGSAVGCRGRLHLALLPLAAMPGWQMLLPAWREGAGALRWGIDTDGVVACTVADVSRHWRLPASRREDPEHRAWQRELPSPPAVLVFGAGPETPTLVPWLRRMGWMTTVVERRPRWSALAALSDTPISESPQAALLGLTRRFDAALVMHHHFELDREALQALAGSDIEYVGLLGPARRREDLFRVLPDTVRAALQPRLRSPVGLDLGGQGPEAITLSIVAQLHAQHRQRP